MQLNQSSCPFGFTTIPKRAPGDCAIALDCHTAELLGSPAVAAYPAAGGSRYECTLRFNGCSQLMYLLFR